MLTSRSNIFFLLRFILLFSPGMVHAENEIRFLKYCQAKASSGDTMAITGQDSWFFLRKELLHLGKGEFWGAKAQQVNTSSKVSNRDPLKAILAYKQQLDKANIDLLFVPIPPKVVIYPDKLDGQFKAPTMATRIDPFHQIFYKLLQDQGIIMLDLVPHMIEGRSKGNVYCQTDSHYAPTGIAIVAQAISDYIKQQPWYSKQAKTSFPQSIKKVQVTGDLLTDSASDGQHKESLTLHVVSGQVESKQSPIVLLSDSHGLIFHTGGDMLAENAGLAGQLAHLISMPIDLNATRGSGATPTRINFYRAAKRDPTYLAGKKLVIWLMTAREFTESSWHPKVPVMIGR